MDEIFSILKAHKNIYPLMQFDDVYKLVYQHCYGPKHMSMSKIDAFNIVKEEALLCKNSNPDIVDIGNGYVRVSIVNDADSINKLSDAFYKTIRNCSRSIDIEETLSKIKKYVCELFEIGTQEYDEKVRYLKEKNYPPMSHSEVYKNNYTPHYRVISKKYINI